MKHYSEAAVERMMKAQEVIMRAMAKKLRKSGAPGAIPTRDLSLRRRTLYAAELREHM